MQPLHALVLCLTGLLALAGAAAAQDVSGSAGAATEHATGSLGVDAGTGGASSGIAGLWAWFGLHLDVLLAKLHDAAGMVGLAAPDLAADADVNVAHDGEDVGVTAGDVTVGKSVGLSPEGATASGQVGSGHASGELAGDAKLPALPALG